MQKIAISQSNYVPWKGYIDMIASVDSFILYDDMQYTKRDWRNRNKIKTPQGLKWVSIPVDVKGKYFQKINQTHVTDSSWASSHWSSIQQNYRKAPHYKETADWLKPLYDQAQNLSLLSDINRLFLDRICQQLGIETEIRSSNEFSLVDGKTERLVDLCEQLGADRYVSGGSAKSYVVEELFEEKKISLEWFDNSAYPEYPQPYGDFEHSVSILDLFFNVGPNAHSYMKFIK
ncbi:MAG: hypothetical protein ACJATK_000414 [Paracoccaceae bacterium]|jgi:hypothetical protein